MTATNQGGGNGDKGRPESSEKTNTRDSADKTTSNLRGDVSNQDREDFETSVKNKRKNRTGNTTGKKLFGHVELNEKAKDDSPGKASETSKSLARDAQGIRSDVPVPQPVAPHKIESAIPQPISPEKLQQQKLASNEEAVANEIPVPKPVAPHKIEAGLPSPIAPQELLKANAAPQPIENFHPQPHAPNKIEAPSPQPIAPHKIEALQPQAAPLDTNKSAFDNLPKPTPPKLDSAMSPEELNKKAVETLRAEQERIAETARKAQAVLPQISAVSMPIPPLPAEIITNKRTHPGVLPVIMPSVLHTGQRQGDALPQPAARPAEPIFVSPAPIKLGDHSVTVQPLARIQSHTESQNAMPAPVPIEINSKSAVGASPSIVPIETYKPSTSDTGPAPMRAKHADITPVDIRPSIPNEATSKAAEPLKGSVTAGEAKINQPPPAVAESKPKILQAGVEVNNHKDQAHPAPEYKSQYSLSAQENAAIFKANAEARNNAPREQQPHPGTRRQASVEQTEANHSLTGGGYLDGQNFFEIPAGVLPANVPENHNVVIKIYNRSSHKEVGEAEGHIQGRVGGHRALIIDKDTTGNNRWVGQRYNLKRI